MGCCAASGPTLQGSEARSAPLASAQPENSSQSGAGRSDTVMATAMASPKQAVSLHTGQRSERMQRVVVDHFGGPEVLRVVEEDDPRPGPGEVRVRVLAAGVSFTDSLLRAGTYLGVPKPPFTPGYELVGVVEELGPGCSRVRVGDRVGALTVSGGRADRS